MVKFIGIEEQREQISEQEIAMSRFDPPANEAIIYTNTTWACAAVLLVATRAGEKAGRYEFLVAR
jgi:hypothetical protein